MVEPEASFYDLDDVMCLAADFVATIVQRVLENRLPELEILERDLAELQLATKTPYPRVSYDEACKIIHENGDANFVRGEDFGAPHETILGEHFDRPVMVHRWPKEIKAFYMKEDPKDNRLALAVDMIVRGAGEIIGGSQREDDLELLTAKIRQHELPEEAFRWYLDVRRYGSVPHGGFGLGVERTVSWISGVEHVRECIPFPRMLNKIYP